MGEKHMIDMSYTIDSFFGDYRQFKNQTQVYQAVQQGEIDVGMVRTGLIPSKPNDAVLLTTPSLRVLDAKFKEDFPYPFTTELYPEYAFAKLSHIDPNLARDIAIDLMQLPPESEASQKGAYHGWTVPMNYYKVHELMKELKVGVFAERIDFSLNEFVKKYFRWLGFLVAMICILLFAILKIKSLNSKLFDKNRIQKELNQKLTIEMQKTIEASLKNQKLAEIGGNLTTTLHDLKNPLVVVQSLIYRIRMERKKISSKSDSETIKEMLSLTEKRLESASQKMIGIIDGVLQKNAGIYAGKVIEVDVLPEIKDEIENFKLRCNNLPPDSGGHCTSMILSV